MKLAALAQAGGYTHIHFESVGSTNVEALKCGRDKTWVTAGMQTEGKGRRGRVWASPPGNLYASLLLLDPATPGKAAQLCFVAALAVSDAIAHVSSHCCDIKLKWPNDILVQDAKIAGILIEGSHSAEHFSVVVGCGINVASHPDVAAYPATHLAQHDKDASVCDCFTALADAFAQRLALWKNGEGFAEIRQMWLMRACGIGEKILVRLPHEDTSGIFETLDEEGALVLLTEHGQRRHIMAGELFFSGHFPDAAKVSIYSGVPSEPE